MSEVTAEMIERGGIDKRIARANARKVQSARNVSPPPTPHRLRLALLRAYANAREGSALPVRSHPWTF